MPRQKISEYCAKQLIARALNQKLVSWEVHDDIITLPVGKGRFVVKVDQAVKKRFKSGLVLLDISPDKIPSAISLLRDSGYKSFIVEPYVTHSNTNEHYLSISRDYIGLHLTINSFGGVDIEKYANKSRKFLINSRTNWSQIEKLSILTKEQIESLVRVFISSYCTLLEINPYVVMKDGSISILDVAMEVDTAAQHLTQDWSESDIRIPPHNFSEIERRVVELNAKSSASFMFKTVNTDGSIFLLLSGGGASVVVADEVYATGFGSEMGNYGEYSGNPTTEETYMYARVLLDAVLSSASVTKVVFIGGAVANFTNIQKTFTGIILAIDELAGELANHNVRFVVRRGGPYQTEGLAMMRDAFKRHGLRSSVYDQHISIGDAVKEAVGMVA